MVEPYIKDGKLTIPKEDWSRLKEEYDEADIRKNIVDHIQNHDIDFPWYEMEDDELRQLVKDFAKLNVQGVQFGETFTVQPYKYEIGPKYFTESNKWNAVSNMFQQENRMKCGYAKIKNMSPLDMFYDRDTFYRYLRGLWTLKLEHICMYNLRSTLCLKGYIAAQFKPAIAKAIYEYFGAKDVLDFSAGWGDRLAGFYAADCTRSYIGIDPNERVYNDYAKQYEYYKETLGVDKKCTFINSPAEKVEIDAEIVDFIFTSPPYFNTEVYNIDQSQSCNQYKTGESWLKGFMFPTIDMCEKALKPGGYLAINIADASYRGKRVEICDPMNDYIKSKGFEYVEGMGLKMAKRPNTDRFRRGECFVEPIWVWKKPAK